MATGIPVTDANAIQARLDEAQARCTARVYRQSDIAELAARADRALTGLPPALLVGATVTAHTDGSVNQKASYNGRAQVTFIELRYINKEWRLIDAFRGDSSAQETFTVALSNRHDAATIGRALAKRDGITLAGAA